MTAPFETWILEAGAGALVGAFLALTPIPLLPYIFWIAMRALWARPTVRWTVTVHVVFNFGFALLPPVLLWLAFRQSVIASVVMAITMYFPYWYFSLIDRFTDRSSKRDRGSH